MVYQEMFTKLTKCWQNVLRGKKIVRKEMPMTINERRWRWTRAREVLAHLSTAYLADLPKLEEYSARTLHMFRHVLLDVEACFGKTARYAVERYTRTPLALVHCHRRSFIVIVISFRALSPPRAPLVTWKKFSSEPYPSPNILFVYHIVLFHLRYLPQMKNPVKRYILFTKMCPLDALIGRKFVFCPPGRFSC